MGGIFLLRNRSVLPRAFGRKEEPAQHRTRAARDVGAHVADPFYLKPELPSDRQPPQEMAQVPHSRYRLGLFELPAAESDD